MRRSVRLTALATPALLLLACAGTRTPAPAPTPDPAAERAATEAASAPEGAASRIGQDEAAATVADLIDDVAAIRGLEFRRDVPVRVIDDAEARDHVERRFDKFVGRDKLEADSLAFELLGLVPPGNDLLDSVLHVLEEQAGGFYDPGTRSFYLLDDMPPGMAPILVAHELTHALEDQHYDLDRRIGASLEDDDRAFATGSIHEGSASLVMTVWMTGAISRGELDMNALTEFQQSEAGRGERLAEMPEILRRQLIGPYILGMSFLAKGNLLSIAGGFPTDDVNRAFDDGPTSSEQILHPEKYWDPETFDPPTTVVVPPLSGVLGEGWERRSSGVLGELGLGVLVGAETPDVNAPAAVVAANWTHDAAAGWDGDRWELWTRGDDAVVVLATMWDSVEDAIEFETALAARETGLRSGRHDATVAVVVADDAIAPALIEVALGKGSP